MKIVQLLSGFDVPVTNEERKFMQKHKEQVSILSLDEHDQWLAQNLVRKGIYSLSKDDQSIIKSTTDD